MAIRKGIYPPNISGKGHTQGGSSNCRKEKPQNPRSFLGTWCSALATEKRAQDIISKGLFIKAQESVTICVAHSWETQTTWDVIICWNPIIKHNKTVEENELCLHIILQAKNLVELKYSHMDSKQHRGQWQELHRARAAGTARALK